RDRNGKCCLKKGAAEQCGIEDVVAESAEKQLAYSNGKRATEERHPERNSSWKREPEKNSGDRRRAVHQRAALSNEMLSEKCAGNTCNDDQKSTGTEEPD